MKRFFQIIIVALTAVSVILSCNKENATGGNDPFGEKGYLTIRFSGSQLTTKATIAGDDTLNENLISYVDLFFYTSGNTDQDATLSFLGKHATLVSGTSDTYEVKIRYTDDQAAALFGSTSSGSCDVYVVANAPTRTYGTSTAIADLKKTVETQYFGSQADGRQDNFIMDGQGTVSFSDGAPEGTVLLERAEAKFSLYASVVNSVTVTEEEEATAAGTWTPLLDQMTISFKNATKTGYIDGIYAHSDDDYFNYDERAMATKVSGTLTTNGTTVTVDFYTHTPFYSFPQSWYDIDPYQSYVLLKIPWKKEGEAKYITSYYQINANRIDRDFLRNTYYKIYTQITNLGSTDLNKPAMIDNDTYVVKDWGKVDVGEGTGDQYIPGIFDKFSYLVVTPTNIDLYNQSSASMFYSSSSDVTIAVNKVEYYDYSSASGKVLITKTSNLSNYAFTTDTENTTINYFHSQSDIYVLETIYATVSNNEGMSEEIVIRQRPAIYIDEFSGDNAFVNGYFGHVLNASFGTTNTGNYKRCSTYRDSYYEPSYSSTVNYGYYSSGNIVMSGYGTVLLDYSNVSGNINSVFITDIHVTAFNSTNNSYSVGGDGPKIYKIGDPRITASSASITGSGWSVNSYLTGESGSSSRATAKRSAWTSPGNILVGSQLSVDQNIIAPEFYISSAWNAMVRSTFDAVVHRGATFQEAGYPAGRWRLPTEAEIAFIMSMQKKGIIPTLFARTSGTYYWAASGRCYDAYNDQFISGDGETASCRFVYDTWYWGSTPLSTNTYHANGHIN